jgi:hypothetical protein
MKYIYLIIVGIFFCTPLLVSAQLPPSQSTGGLPPSQVVGGQPRSGDSFSVPNPLNADSISEFVAAVLEAVIVIGIPVAVLFMVLAGFKFVLAMGNPKKIGEAQRNLVNTVIGIGLFLGAWTIAKIIQATVEALGAGTGL